MDLKILKDLPPWEWPEDAAKTFLDILRDPQASEADRRLAAELGGDFTVINDALADALLSIVSGSDQSEELRSQAAISLGPALEQVEIEGFDFPDDVPISEPTFERIRQTLRKLYADASVPAAVRRSILEASVRTPQDWHHEAVRAAYSTDDPAWRLTAVFCMRFIRGFDPQILEALESGDPNLELQAVCAAGNWELNAAWEHVADLAASEYTEKGLRLAAIEAIAMIDPPASGDILGELLESDDEEIVDAASEALGFAAALADEDEEEFQ